MPSMKSQHFASCLFFLARVDNRPVLHLDKLDDVTVAVDRRVDGVLDGLWNLVDPPASKESVGFWVFLQIVPLKSKCDMSNCFENLISSIKQTFLANKFIFPKRINQCIVRIVN